MGRKNKKKNTKSALAKPSEEIKIDSPTKIDENPSSLDTEEIEESTIPEKPTIPDSINSNEYEEEKSLPLTQIVESSQDSVPTRVLPSPISEKPETTDNDNLSPTEETKLSKPLVNEQKALETKENLEHSEKEEKVSEDIHIPALAETKPLEIQKKTESVSHSDTKEKPQEAHINPDDPEKPENPPKIDAFDKKNSARAGDDVPIRSECEGLEEKSSSVISHSSIENPPISAEEVKSPAPSHAATSAISTESSPKKGIYSEVSSEEPFYKKYEREKSQPDLTAPKPPPRVEQFCMFTIGHEVKFGEKIVMVGNTPELGNWDPYKGLDLTWSPNHIWSATLNYSDLPFEYKYVIVSSSQVNWEKGSNRLLTKPLTNIIDHWQFS